MAEAELIELKIHLLIYLSRRAKILNLLRKGLDGFDVKLLNLDYNEAKTLI